MAENVAATLSRAVAAHQAGRLAEAEAGYRTVLARAPGQADALNLLGVLAAGRGDHQGALGLFDRAIAALPKFADVHFNKANTLAAMDDIAAAEAGYRTALKHNPRHADAWMNLGALLAKAGQLEGAIEAYREMIRCAERDPRGYFNLGRCLIDHKRPAEAVTPLRRALELDPASYDAHLALGDAHADLDQRDAAIAHLSTATKLKPNTPAPYIRKGKLASDAGDLAGALAAYGAALDLDPENITARVNRGLAHLARGEFAPGWGDYALRHLDPDFKYKRQRRALPEWQGEDLAGKSLLVTGDQGLGDEILYASMIPDLARRGGAITVACAARLAPLFARSFPGVMVSSDSDLDPQAHFDFQTTLIDLGHRFRIEAGRFPNRPRHLYADTTSGTEFQRWCDHQRAAGLAVVGCSWRSINPEIGEQKSVPLKEWAPVFRQRPFAFVNVQYGNHQIEIDAYRTSEGRSPFADCQIDGNQNLDELAAHLVALDLVITVSNTTAHLAAALGIPTWIIVPTGKGALWYWLDHGDKCLWYPSVRIFRAPRGASTAKVIEQISISIVDLTSQAAARSRV